MTRRRFPRWLLAIPIVGAIVVMAMIAVVPGVISCGGGSAYIRPPGEIAATPGEPAETVARK